LRVPSRWSVARLDSLPDRRVTLLNRMAEELTGWRTEDAVGRPLAEVLHIIDRDSRACLARPLIEVLETSAIVRMAKHALLVGKGGTEPIIADSAAPIRDKDSRIVGVVLVFRDVTEKERLEVEDGRFALLILDLTIPGGLGGREALRRLRQAGIDTPAIASSGYASNPIMAEPAAYGCTAAITKPYDIFELCRVIRSATSVATIEKLPS